MNLEKGIIWLDIETTGIDPIDDKILEVCLIITDKDLKVLATKNVVIKHNVFNNFEMFFLFFYQEMEQTLFAFYICLFIKFIV